MERRLRLLESQFRPSASPRFVELAFFVAREMDLEPAELLAEADAIFAAAGNRWLSAEAIAADMGASVAELIAEADRILAKVPADVPTGDE